jgi:hypothetical protein
VLIIHFFSNSDPQRIIRSDGNGYYAYLTAVFIYQDLSYSFYDDILDEYYGGREQEYRIEINDRIINKNWPGVAFLWLPFFLLAHLFSWLFGLSTDGYGILYQYSLGIACLFYVYLGLLYLRKFLNIYNIQPYAIAITQAIIVFATPLLNYAVTNPVFTHAYSFTLIMFFLFYVKKTTHHYKEKYYYYLAAILG